MGVAGSLTYDTKLDTKGFQKGVNDITNKAKTGGSTVKNIVAGLGITKIISSAFNVITNSLDGAISRFDIMNNFPKVLKNLGFSATDAKNSVNKLANGLDGLPTALDSAVVSVQRLVSKNGDIDKSTEYFLAMNNAILSGGASMTIQESALEQLTQSYSKGKPDLMEWRTLQMAMPGQLKEVAQAMGYVSDSDLYEAFKDGTVSMEEFMDTIVRLNKEGINGLASFEEQAKDATGGISTSLTNLKTRIKKGLTTILDNINESLAKHGTSISKIIDTIGINIRNMLESIGKYLPTIINFAIKGFEIIKKILPYITPLIAGFIAFSAVLKTLEIIKTITIAFATFNAVLMANPIALIIAGIVAFISGIVLLWNKCKAFRDFWIGLWDKIKVVVKPVIDYIKIQFIALWYSIKVVWDKAKPYFDLLWNAIKKNIKPILDSISKFFSDTWNNIKAYWEPAKQFFSNVWNHITETIKPITESINNAFKEAWELIKVVWDLVAPYFKQTWENIKIVWNAVKPYFETIWNGIQAIFSVVQEVLGGFFKVAWETIKAVWDIVTSYFKAVWDSIALIFSVVKDVLTGDWQGAWEGIKSIVNTWKDFFSGVWDSIKNVFSIAINTIIDLINSLLEKVSYVIVKIGEKLWNWITIELPKIINGIITWFKELPSKIWEQLKQIPNKFILMATNLINIARTEIPKFVNIFVNFMNELPRRMLNIGVNIVKGIWNGINNAKDWLINKIKGFAKSITNGIKKALGIHSPSKVMKEQVGQWIPKGIAVGIEANTDSALESLNELSDEIINKMQNAVYTDSGKMSFSGTSGSVTQILNANSSFTGNINNVLELDGEVVYNNQQKITARKNLQRGGVR